MADWRHLVLSAISRHPASFFEIIEDTGEGRSRNTGFIFYLMSLQGCISERIEHPDAVRRPSEKLDFFKSRFDVVEW